jgi:hypothetical protein
MLFKKWTASIFSTVDHCYESAASGEHKIKQVLVGVTRGGFS